ncbi:hypothetical protein B0J14DRAFT_704266 [Halenospora varia]|nr:hypothetical protein B0J14DRAFT_704266 [Halenospora varia]
MSKQGEDLLRTLVSAFQDANLGISRYRGIPFVQDETAESHLVRIMDFWNIEMWDDTSTNAISKEVILTLLQCAARLYESKWDGQDSCGGVNGDGMLAPNFGATREANQDDFPNASKVPPPPHVIRGANQNVNMSNVLEFEKWIDLLRNSAMNYPKSTSVGAVTSALKLPHEFHNQATSQKEERTPVSIRIEREDIRDYHKELKDGLLSPSGGIPDGDWNLLRSDDDSENIFPFSPDARSDAANGRSMSTLLRDADNERYDRIPSAKDAQPTFPSVGAASLKSTNEDSQRWLNVSEPGEWMRGHYKTKLSTIPEEP